MDFVTSTESETEVRFSAWLAGDYTSLGGSVVVVDQPGILLSFVNPFLKTFSYFSIRVFTNSIFFVRKDEG